MLLLCSCFSMSYFSIPSTNLQSVLIRQIGLKLSTCVLHTFSFGTGTTYIFRQASGTSPEIQVLFSRLYNSLSLGKGRFWIILYDIWSRPLPESGFLETRYWLKISKFKGFFISSVSMLSSLVGGLFPGAIEFVVALLIICRKFVFFLIPSVTYIFW